MLHCVTLGLLFSVSEASLVVSASYLFTHTAHQLQSFWAGQGDG